MSQKAKSRRASATRWLYRQEAKTMSFNSYANQRRPMKFLRRLAERVWRAHAPAGRRMPSITAGRGVRHGDQWLSYCLGYTKIVLARNQRTIMVLLHELTHALGPGVHGPQFVKTYFPLLNKYAGFNRWFLQSVAAERSIFI